MPDKIAIQGIKASFHDVAARKYFGNDSAIIECNTFKETFDAVYEGSADYLVVAIENTIAGTLLTNYALLKDYSFKIIGEVYLHIQMNLMALKGTQMKDLEYIQSHPMAIRQCAEYLYTLDRNINILEKYDTAACAREVADKDLHHTAAIANEHAAKTYGLEILEKRIETNKQNFTRFLIVAKHKKIVNKANKASIAFQTSHGVGALADILRTFKSYNINLSKLQSMPLVGKPYTYYFHADLEWEDYEDYTKSIKEVLDQAADLSILGEYQRSTYSFNE